MRWSIPILTGVVLSAAAVVVVPRLSKTEPVSTKVAEAAPAVPAAPAHSQWCGDAEALPSDVCYIDGREGKPRRTLVIWLHGVIGKTTNWSQDHIKMLTRISKSTDIEMLFPKGILGEQAYAWPGTPESQAENEEALIAQWMTAKAALEKRDGKPFDETFIFGFSSGAYFASSLAMRGRADVNGYAVFAGGQAPPQSKNPDQLTRGTHIVPVFVGVCADDPTGTAAHSRNFAGALATAGIPRMVSEENVGHDISPTHFTGALSFLRKQREK